MRKTSFTGLCTVLYSFHKAPKKTKLDNMLFGDIYICSNIIKENKEIKTNSQIQQLPQRKSRKVESGKFIVLGRPKSLFHNIVQKNLNELPGQPNSVKGLGKFSFFMVKKKGSSQYSDSYLMCVVVFIILYVLNSS